MIWVSKHQHCHKGNINQNTNNFLHSVIIIKLIFVVVELLNHVKLFVTPWTAAHQASLSMRFPRQEYWSGLSFLSPRELSDSGYFLSSPSHDCIDRVFGQVYTGGMKILLMNCAR